MVAAAATGRGRRRAGVCEEKEAGLGIGPAGSSTAQLYTNYRWRTGMTVRQRYLTYRWRTTWIIRQW